MKRVIIVAVLLLFLGSGCGMWKPETDPTEVETHALTQDEYEKQFFNREPFDPLQGEWKVADNLPEEVANWGIADMRENSIPKVESSEELCSRFYTFMSVDKKDLYTFSYYMIYDKIGDYPSDYTERRYYLTRLDGNTLETEEIFWRKYDSQEEAGPMQGGVVTAMDCYEGNIRIVEQVFDEETGNILHCYVHPFTMDGTEGESVDLTESLVHCGLLKGPSPLLLDADFKFDSQGYYYFLDDSCQELFILDDRGPMVGSIRGEELDFFCKTMDGYCIWKEEDRERKESIYFVFEKDAKRELFREPMQSTALSFLNQYGDLYQVEEGRRLICRSIPTGKKDYIYGSAAEFRQAVAVWQNDRGEVLCMNQDDQGRYCLTVYSPTVATREVTLSLYSTEVYSNDTHLGQMIQTFQRRHPGVKIQVEYARENKDREWIELTTALSKGEGPDLLYVPRKELKLLAQKGALMELDQILQEDVKKQIFDAVLEYGTVGDKLYGLTFQGSIRTLLVPEQVWSARRWTIEDVIGLLREREETGSPYLGVCNDWYSDNGLTAQDMLQFFMEGVATSPFLDLEKGTCCFDSPIFSELLQVCKQYGKPKTDFFSTDSMTMENQYHAVVQEKLLGFAPSNYSTDFISFSEAMAGLQDSCHIVGYPTEGDSGNYFVGGCTMAVNKNTKETELVKEFLNFLYSTEVQTAIGTVSVRKDFLGDCSVKRMDWADSYCIRVYGNGGWLGWTPIATRPDGTTYLEDYLELMDRCVCRPEIVEEVQTIILEEAEAYFADDKDPGMVANIIQSRVKLCISE